MTGRERILRAFDNQPVDRVPLSFWFHFLEDEAGVDALADPSLLDKSFEGHRQYIRALRPDFVKVMCDGLFLYPCEAFEALKAAGNPADLEKVHALGADDPWIRAHLDIVRRIVSIDRDLCYIYNVFSPSSLFRILVGEARYLELLRRDPDAVQRALGRMAQGLSILAAAVIREAGAYGVYYCVQNPNVDELSDEDYARYISPSDKVVLGAAKDAGGLNILHICGYEGRRNHLEQWVDYDATAFNWASHVEGVGLSEGKKLFGGKPVVGGFDNTVNGVLYRGTREEVEACVEALVADVGRTGLVVAADCSLPFGIEVERLIWVRDKLEAMG